MGIKYRVDRARHKVTPCGMNSIVYIGDNRKQAQEAFEQAEIGLNEWNQPNSQFGVVLSVWQDQAYEVIGYRTTAKNLLCA